MLCRALRSVGFLCIAVDYRYWPQTTIDGMVEDVNEAVAWSFQHCEAYGGDRKQVAQLGFSSAQCDQCSWHGHVSSNSLCPVQGFWDCRQAHTLLHCSLHDGQHKRRGQQDQARGSLLSCPRLGRIGPRRPGDSSQNTLVKTCKMSRTSCITGLYCWFSQLLPRPHPQS